MFLRSAMQNTRVPTKITLDDYGPFKVRPPGGSRHAGGNVVVLRPVSARCDLLDSEWSMRNLAGLR